LRRQTERRLADMPVSFGGDAFTRFAQRPERREQTGEARGPQRLIDFSGLTAKLLDRRCGVMADAIDREEHVIGPAHEAGQQSRTMLDAAIMVEETRSDALDQSLQLRNLMSPATDVEDRDARQIEGFPCFRLDDRGEMAFDGL
jgi:hypothetical protein